MNILWIEDNANIKALRKRLFPEKYFKNDLNELVIPKSFDETHDIVEHAIADIDFVVIDINLENFSIGNNGKKLAKRNKLSDNDFLENAGFDLYVMLLLKGFPADRMVFLTGNTSSNQLESFHRKFKQARYEANNADVKSTLGQINSVVSADNYSELQKLITEANGNWEDIDTFLELLSEESSSEQNNSYENFKRLFKDARMPLALSINKGESKDFDLWLKQKITEQNDEHGYIVLRRGIIDGCKYIQKLLGKPEDTSDKNLFNKLVEEPLTNEYFIHYLDKIGSLLPHKKPGDLNKTFGSFSRELSFEWERCKHSEIRESSPGRTVENNFKSFCQKQMKFLRNWSVHGLLTDELREKDIAFFFMIAMRAIIEMSIDRSNKYERQLGVLFKKQELLTASKMKIKLASSYEDLLSLFKKHSKKNPYNYHFSTLITDFGFLHRINKEILKKESLKLFYQNFWHYMNPMEFKILKTDSKSKKKLPWDSVRMNIFFKYNKLEFVFPKMIGEWIFSESF